MVTKEITPLYQAARIRINNDVVKLLLERKDININGITKIKEASDEVDKVKEGEKVVDKEETTLHETVAKENVQIVTLLLGNKNIDINITDKQGRKPKDLSTKEEIIALINHSS